MMFPITLNETEIPLLIQKFYEIAGPSVIGRKFEWINREMAENKFMAEWLHEYHGTEMRLQELFLEISKTGEFPRGTIDAELYDLYSFIAGFVQIHERLSEKGQKRFKGMLFDGLTTDKGLSSVKHEVNTAINLMRRGYDVEFNDIENGNGVDYIARREGMELEIECKVFTCDIGRQIHKRRSINLLNLLHPQLSQIFQTASKGLLIRIVLPGRLTPNHDQMRKIVDTVSLAVLNGKNRTNTDVCDIEVLDFVVESSPFYIDRPEELDQKKVVDFISKLTGIAKLNPNLAILFSPKHNPVIALLESAIPDQVLNGMERQLRDAAKGQFSKARPGVLSIHVNALNGEQLVALADLASSDPLNPTGLRVMTAQFLEKPHRSHIHSVSYQARGRVSFDKATGATVEEGVSYYFSNPNNVAFGDERCRVYEKTA